MFRTVKHSFIKNNSNKGLLLSKRFFSQPISGAKLVRQVKFSGGPKGKPLDVQVLFGDLFEQSVDAIVHPTTRSLTLHDGMHFQLLQKAGADYVELNKELLESHVLEKGNSSIAIPATGLLRCRHVIHSFPPVWESENIAVQTSSLEELTNCIKSSLECADRLQAKSIAIPPIGSGSVFRFPQYRVARAIFNAIEEYLEQVPAEKRSLEAIKLTEKGWITVGVFCAEFDDRNYEGMKASGSVVEVFVDDKLSH